MSESDDIYDKTLVQMELCRDRALEMGQRITTDLQTMSVALMALHRDISWLKRYHAALKSASLPPAETEERST